MLTKKAISELKQQIKNTQSLNFSKNEEVIINKTLMFFNNSSISNTRYNNVNKYRFKDLFTLSDKLNEVNKGFIQDDIHILNEVVENVNKTNTIKKNFIYKVMIL